MQARIPALHVWPISCKYESQPTSSALNLCSHFCTLHATLLLQCKLMRCHTQMHAAAGDFPYFAPASTLTIIEFILFAWVEVRRYQDMVKPGSTNQDPIFSQYSLPSGNEPGYPGGIFNPLGFGKSDMEARSQHCLAALHMLCLKLLVGKFRRARSSHGRAHPLDPSEIVASSDLWASRIKAVVGVPSAGAEGQGDQERAAGYAWGARCCTVSTPVKCMFWMCS